MNFRDMLARMTRMGVTDPDVAQKYLLSPNEIQSEIEAEPGLIRLPDGTVWLVNPDLTVTQVLGGPGGGPWGQSSTAKFSGSGSPVGVVTPTGVGDLYTDHVTPALWQATGVTDTDWQVVGNGGSQPLKSFVSSALASDTALSNTPAQLAFDFPVDGSNGSDVTLSADGETLTLVNDGVYSLLLDLVLQVTGTPDGAVTVTANGALVSGDPLQLQGLSLTVPTPLAAEQIQLVIPAMWFSAGSALKFQGLCSTTGAGAAKISNSSSVIASRVS